MVVVRDERSISCAESEVVQAFGGGDERAMAARGSGVGTAMVVVGARDLPAMAMVVVRARDLPATAMVVVHDERSISCAES
jgi:hypothetical protein